VFKSVLRSKRCTWLFVVLPEAAVMFILSYYFTDVNSFNKCYAVHLYAIMRLSITPAYLYSNFILAVWQRRTLSSFLLHRGEWGLCSWRSTLNILAGDFNKLDCSKFEVDQGMTQLVNQATYGNSVLDKCFLIVKTFIVLWV